MSRESQLVELVSVETGAAVGTATVADAHSAPGRMHRAFSVMLFDQAGRVLLQRRAAGKTRFAGRWSNACCGHPPPGQDPLTAAGHRLREELGLNGLQLTEIDRYVYHATDPATGRVEHEYDHVLTGLLPAATPIHPDPTEVGEVRWLSPVDLYAALAATPDAYTPWLPGVLKAATRNP